MADPPRRPPARPRSPTSRPAPAGRDRFTPIRQLGEGATASVHLAWDRHLGRHVALKLLAPGLVRSEAMRARFRREARVLAALAHPGIVRVLGIGETEGAAWIAMEYVPGGSLAAWLRRHGPMPPALAARCVAEVCEAVAAAHAAGVVHRDLKPHNVLIDAGDRCRVADFGIARLRDPRRAASLTRTGVTMGTPGYMAPEQRADAKAVDHRADVWSLGATLYALLTGRAPADLPDDLDRPPPIPDELALVILRATLRRPDHRYPDVARLGRALRRALDRLPPPPADTPPLFAPGEAPPEEPGPTFVPEEA